MTSSRVYLAAVGEGGAIGATGPTGPTGPGGAAGPTGATGPLANTHSITPFGRNGTLSAVVGLLPFPVPTAITIVGFRARVGTAPVGASIIVDVFKNGSDSSHSLWPTLPANRPTILSGANDSGGLAVPDLTSLAAGDYLLIDVAQIGSSTPGADLGLTMVFVAS